MRNFVRVDSFLNDRYLNININGLEIQVVKLTYVHPSRNWNVNVHEHLDFELHFITTGRGTALIGKKEHQLTAGDFFITGPHVPHSHFSDPDDPMGEYCLECTINDNVSIAETIVAAHDRPYRSNEVFHVLKMIIDEVCGASSAKIMSLQGLTLLLISKLYSVVSNTSISINENKECTPPYQAIIDFIEANYAKDISLTDASNALFMCQRQINRIMKHGCGTTFHQYLISTRLEHARILIEKGNNDFEEVASLCGFSDKFYMYQSFKRNGLLPPGKYRK